MSFIHPSNDRCGGDNRQPSQVALSLGIALVLLASACGSGSDTDQASIDDVTQTTLSSGDVSSSDDSASNNSASDDDETSADATGTTEAPTPQVTEDDDFEPGLALSVADDVVLSPDLERDEILALLSATMGPTDDLSAAVDRLTPTKHKFPTMADTEVIQVNVNLSRRGVDDFVVYSPTIEFITTASRQDTILAYETTLESDGWEPDTAERMLGGVQRSTITARDADPIDGLQGSSVSISITDRAEGGSVVEMAYSDNSPDLELIGLVDGWFGNSPLPPGGRTTNVQLVAQADPNDSRRHLVSLYTTLRFDGTTPEDVSSQAQSLIGASDWELNNVNELNELDLRVNYLGDSGTVFISETGLEDDLYVRVVLQQSWVKVAAASPVSPATEVEVGSEAAGNDTEPGEIEFASPNGSELAREMDYTAIEGLLVDVLGPTDDLGGTFARLGPFPAGVPTMSETVITDVSADYGFLTLSTDSFVFYGMTAKFLTTTTPEDAVLTLQTELAPAGWTTRQADTVERDDVIYHNAVVEAPTEAGESLQITAFTLESGETLASIQFIARLDADLSVAEVANGWYGEDAAIVPGGEFGGTRIAASYFQTDRIRIDMESEFEYTDTTEAELIEALVVAADGSSDWSFNELYEDEIVVLDFKDLSTRNFQSIVKRADSVATFLSHGYVLQLG